tara:strand:+ start:670 stop:1557 length:888 start_codon:yes stop_codon:yes gene_type:complete
MGNIKKYIAAEKDISKFRLGALKRLSKPYTKRLAEKEKRFLAFDFHSCNFNDIEEAREALDLFRSSERDFYIQYGFEVKEDEIDYDSIAHFLKEIKGDVICNKYNYLDYTNKKIFNGDGSIKKVICDRNIFLSDFISHIIKNINYIESTIYYDSFKSSIIKSMYDSRLIGNIEDLIKKNFSNLSIDKKTSQTKLLCLNMEHSGNEKIMPISCSIQIGENSFNILKFNNVKKNGKYFKALKISDENLNKIEDIKFEKSYCLVFKTRRATESFLQIEKNIKIILKELSEKFDINLIL